MPRTHYKEEYNLAGLWLCAILGLIAPTVVSAENPYAPRENWAPTRESLNLSTFSYMDRNENGIYDLGDQPIAGIQYVLLKDAEERARATSNENGFANFPSSRTSSNTAIYDLGDYTFLALVPPGWTVSSNNTAQTQRFIEAPETSTGGVLDKMPDPVGFVPPKSISGKVATGQDLTISGPGLSPQVVDIDENGTFSVTVPQRGRYHLRAGDISRAVDIAEYPVNIGTLRAPGPEAGSHVTMTFDDISANWLRKVPSGYGGLNWFNINAIKNTFSQSSRGYINGATSGSWVAYTSSGHPTRISRADGFDFVQMNITLAWPSGEGETAIFEYWRGDTIIGTDEVTLSAFTPVVYAPRLTDVTKVRILTRHYWQMVMDDFTVGLKP